MTGAVVRVGEGDWAGVPPDAVLVDGTLRLPRRISGGAGTRPDTLLVSVRLAGRVTRWRVEAKSLVVFEARPC